jgi:hypothetical protein
MNVSNAQIKALRVLISKEDKQQIATQLGNSVRTIEAVLSCDRTNDEIVQVHFEAYSLQSNDPRIFQANQWA